MKRLCYALLVLCLLLGAALPAVAAEEGASFWSKNKTMLEQIAAVINFLIFLWLIVKYGGPKIKATFDTKAKEYRGKGEAAAQALAEAREAAAEWRQRRDQLDQEIDRIKADVSRMAESQAEQIVAGAKLAAERMLEDARRSALADVQRAAKELRDELVNEVMDKTEAKLRERLTPVHQKMLIKEAIGKLEISE